MSNVTILASGERHLLRIYRKFEERSVGLGDDFDSDFQKACALLSQHPQLARKYDHTYRRFLMLRWNVGIFYTITGNRILIAAAADLRQSPDTIRRILNEQD